MLLHYQLLPTDERFLALRPWECAWLFWLNHYHGKLAQARVRARTTGERVSIQDVLAEEGSMTDEEFMAKVSELDAIDEAKARGLSIPAPPKTTGASDETPEDIASFSATPPWMGPPPFSRRP